ncbi:glycoside hydrolase family 3 protein [Candidatus Kapaibacterium sp.]
MKRLLFLVLVIFTNSYLFSLDTNSIKRFDSRVWNLIKQFTIDEKISTVISANKQGIPRLDIPDYQWHNESEHGLCIENVTVFPQSINLASTWNTKLMHEVASAISDEARVKFRHGAVGLNFWSPAINIARDPRWGRVQETYGEDPYLASRMSVAYIMGMQGDHPDYFKTIATPKHYVAHSGPEGIRHQFDAIVKPRDLWETYMPAFKASIEEAGAFSIMAAFNAYNGRPVVTNTYLLQEILRNQWGFLGFVTTDCNAIGDSFWEHKVGQNEREGAALAMISGVDSECGDFFRWHLKNALNEGYITESTIDTAVFRLYRAKHLLGLYDDPNIVPYNNIPDSLVDGIKHDELALRTGKESIILLKNDKNTLPLKKDLKKILVIGPNANVFYENLGSYTGWPSKPVTILEGIKKIVSPETEVIYSREIEIGGSLTELITPKYVRTNDNQPGFLGEYFNNRFMEGEPKHTRVDTSLDFDWGFVDPAPGVSADSFSVRWTGIIKVPESGEYTFKVTSDDGTRLTIGDKIVIDDYTPHSSITRIGFFNFEADKDYRIKIEYLQHWAPGNIRYEIGNRNTGAEQLARITEMAKDFDAAIFVGGLSADWENEQSFLDTEGFQNGDRTILSLPSLQTKVVEAMHKSGTPTIMINLGTACALNIENQIIPTILNIGYLGQVAGNAVASVIFGDYNPAGRTTQTYYKSAEDLPDFSNYDMNNRTYRYFNGEVLYPFGYGLSYTQFEYSNLKYDQNVIKFCENDSVKFIYNLKNIGDYDGDEVVQLYVKNLDSRLTQPIKQLKQFKRINLKSGQSVLDTLSLSISELYSFDDSKSKYIIETGKYEVEIGASSKDIRLRGIISIDNCGVENVSIKEDNVHSIVYPNPAKENFVVKINNLGLQNLKISIFDVIGNKIEIPYELDDISSSIYFNCNGLAQGVYTLTIQNDKNILINKIIINK